jgi:quercetin dioxygenase-like cupin family protein
VRVFRTWESAPTALDTDHFTGPGTRWDLGRIEAPNGSALLVRFEAGTRNHWHRHQGGQLLYVTEGAGLVGDRKGEVARLGPGDLVYAPPHEEHWHGASDQEAMTHLALSFGETEWLEPASGAEHP